MSMKNSGNNLTIIHKYGVVNTTEVYPPSLVTPAPVYGVNLFLGGAVLGSILFVAGCLCYCCHRTRIPHSSVLSEQYYRDTRDRQLDIYTLENERCYGTDDFSIPEEYGPPAPGPPPSYEDAVTLHRFLFPDIKMTDESGLPSYELATKMKADESGYEYV